jgi:hypothetical protein
MNFVAALELSARLLAVLALIQSYEFHRLSYATADRGVWRWRDLEAELGPPFGWLLSERSFFFLNLFRALVAIDALFTANWHSVFILFLIHVLTLLRWLGTFNGGSDYMNLLLLWLVSLGLWRQGTMAKVCVYYMGFQLCLSYFKAGWIKLRNSNWRHGRALPAFLRSNIYERSPRLEGLAAHRNFSVAASWTIILFEVSFPVAVLNSHLTLVYMAAGLAFHAGNAYVFGLNRFFFAWLAAYPAIYAIVSS